jgi:hypothetical protein
MVSFDDVSFDTAGFVAQTGRDDVRVWHAPSGDGVGLYMYLVAPDLPAAVDDLPALRAYYRALADASGLGVVEIEPCALDGCRAVRTIFKAPQPPTGRTYVGALTLPFRDFSFVFKVQCPEIGPTGVRDAVVLDALLRDGMVAVDRAGGMTGWLADPYEPARVGPMTRNRSEAPEYDAQFPDHPLARARATLRHIAATARVSDAVRRASAHAPHPRPA